MTPPPTSVYFVLSFVPTVIFDTANFTYYGIGHLAIAHQLRTFIALSHNLGEAVVHYHHGKGMFLRLIRLPRPGS